MQSQFNYKDRTSMFCPTHSDFRTTLTKRCYSYTFIALYATTMWMMWGKKLHHFIFPIALSKRHLLRQFFAHIYFNKFPIICLFHSLYIVRDGEPALVLKVRISAVLQVLYRSGYIKILCEILMSWGDVWMMVRQASSKVVIDQTIAQWGFRLRT